LLLFQGELPSPMIVEAEGALLTAFSTKAPLPGRKNEDAVGVVDLGTRGVVAVVADGAGGHSLGDRAAELAVRAVVRLVIDAEDVRAGVLAGFDAANAAVLELGVGAATTLAVAHLSEHGLRTYHTGDSAILVVGQRGKLKSQTIAHSPVGYAIEAGVLDELDAMTHDERHIVSNLIGTREMRIEVGPLQPLNAFDTVVVASDGLFDNLGPGEVGELVRKGSLEENAKRLAAAAHDRMEQERVPSKPDDLSFVILRARHPKVRRSKSKRARAATPPGRPGTHPNALARRRACRGASRPRRRRRARS
jgi:serine/threonine protein phosphatase PrpC